MSRLGFLEDCKADGWSSDGDVKNILERRFLVFDFWWEGVSEWQREGEKPKQIAAIFFKPCARNGLGFP